MLTVRLARGLSAALLVVPTFATAQALAVRQALESITEADVRARVHIIADDSMGGRDTPSRGLDLTAEYAAGEFRKFGLTPGGDRGGYVQRYALKSPPPRSDASDRIVHASRTTGGVPSVRDKKSGATAPNVVGIVEGSDSLLKHEYIVFSAHMDHVGTQASAGGDSIWNGADDDASGTAAVIELAEAYSMRDARPRRSLIFLLVSGEEKGLLGSEYFARQLDRQKKLVANINIDMIGRNWRDTIAVIGMEHSDLGATLEAVSKAHPALGMQPVGDLWPNEHFYFRSDHYTFARRGVPVLFFFNGTHADYHQASDSPDKIDAEKEARIVRLIFLLGQAIGNADAPPQWDQGSYRKIVDRSYQR
ncbi:MAG: M20/M25/M40 family metallo-hydrolase [Gemmatimonadaceae bacterium]